jgi:hypothetical protein
MIYALLIGFSGPIPEVSNVLDVPTLPPEPDRENLFPSII